MPDTNHQGQLPESGDADQEVLKPPEEGRIESHQDERRWQRNIAFPAMVGLIGALIGVVAGLGGTLLSLRHDESQHEADVRREAYVALIGSAEEYVGNGQITAVAYSGIRSSDQSAFEADLRRWRELMLAKARVDIVGSLEQVENVYDMQMALQDLRDLILEGATHEEWDRDYADVAEPLADFRLQAREESASDP